MGLSPGHYGDKRATKGSSATAVLIKIRVFLEATPCRLVNGF